MSSEPSEEELVKFKNLLTERHPGAVAALDAFNASGDKKGFNENIISILIQGEKYSSITSNDGPNPRSDPGADIFFSDSLTSSLRRNGKPATAIFI